MPFRFYRNVYMCFYCGCPFNDSVKLKQHNEEEHSDTKIRASFKSLLRNSKVKFEISEVKCKLCSAQFTKLDQLLDHLETTHSFKYNPVVKSELHVFKLREENMACQECGESFSFFSTLLKHFHALHNKNVPYLCEICGMGFVAKQNVAAHVRHVHSKNMPCKRCLNTKRDPNNCKHKSLATKRKCKHCPEILDSHYLYKRHLIKVHDVKKYQFKCDLCDITFSAKAPLIQHKQRVHLKEKSFACEICGFRAFNKPALRLHMVSHDDTRPFECEFCKKTFQRKKTLEFHRRIHTNDKRCVCKECGKAFVQTTSLKLHYRVHHPKDEKKDSERTWN